MQIVREFKEFAVKGNVMDMAVGVVIGTAFGKIVTSLVGDVVMPPIGLMLGGVSFVDLAVTLKQALGEQPAVTVNYGKFLQTIIDFLIIACTIFFAVKVVNSMKRKEQAKPTPPPPAPDEEIVLLTEIRDLLRK